MKREIKFRVWDAERKGFLHKIDIDNDIIYVDCKWYIHGGNALDDNYVMQQYTGVKDMSGTEIYEGDIVRYISNDGNMEDCNGVVEFLNGSFIVNWGGLTYECFIDITAKSNIIEKLNDKPAIVVIGNIFENSELLK